MTPDVAVHADRHMQPDPQDILAPAELRAQGSVRVVVQSELAGTYASQHTAWTLVNMLARQFGLVVHIEVDAPEAALLPGVAAFGQANTLGMALCECIRLIGEPHVTVRESTDEAIDIELVIGASPRSQTCGKRWYLHAEGWRWYVGEAPCSSGNLPSSNPVALGPHLAACFAAGEVFKQLRGLKERRGKFIESFFGSAWSGDTAASWDELEDGPPLEALVLPHIYVVGGGAVAQACLFALGASGLQGSLTVIDDDTLDISNNNRYVLSMASDHEDVKVRIAERYLERTKIVCIPVEAKWDAFVREPKIEWSRSDLLANERARRYPIVLSDVDKNRPRHEIQNVLPRLIVGGSTDGMTARAQIVDWSSETACLKCFNPLEDTVAIAHAKIEEARQGDDTMRATICRDLGISVEELKRVMGATGCGELMPADVERFGAGPRQMSVGFVSVAAGVLQATQLLRSLLLDGNCLGNGELVAVAFGTGRIKTIHVARDHDCDCGEERHHRWRRWWS